MSWSIVIQMFLFCILGANTHRPFNPGDSKWDVQCYTEFSKYDANAFLSSGRRSTPRECCHESYCEKQGEKCKTEQYRSYIARKFASIWSCPSGQLISVTSWCKGHYNYNCNDICKALSRNRCENGGTCVPKGSKFTCLCQQGFEGELCQVNIDDCTPNPCNTTTSINCIDGANDYTCKCKPGYYGKYCDKDINECLSNPCNTTNTVNCLDVINDYKCICKPGYTDRNCNTDINECESSPCKNGATCNNKVNRFTCDCPPRLYGVLCDTNICHPTPADVVFVLDSSVSMTEQEFNKQLEFVAKFSSNVRIGPHDFQISVVTFSSDAYVEFYLDQYKDNSSLHDAIMNITYKPGTTRTDIGLEKVATEIFSPKHSIERRINGTMASRFVYVLTDGLSSYRMKTKQKADALRSIVDTIAVIGVGNGVSHEELISIAGSNPSFVYSVENFNSLYTVLKRLVHFDCDECETSAESDVAIFLDSSFSVTAEQYSLSIDAIIHMIDVMKRLSVNDTRVGVTSFADEIRNVIDNGETFNKDIIKSRLNLIAQSKVKTQLPLETVYTYIRNNVLNKVFSRQSAKKFLLIFTNGRAEINDKSALEREKYMLMSVGVNIVAIGSGEDIGLEGLFLLVNDTFNVFVTDKDSSLSNLDVLQSEFVYNKCDLKGE